MQEPLILAMLITAQIVTTGNAAEGPPATCRVHGPSRLASGGDTGTSDYVPHYGGECRDGVAHGQGRLEWHMRWTPGRIRAVWEGRFVDGVFVGTQAVEHVVALPGDRYLVLFADDGRRRIWLVSRSGQFDPMSLCDIDRVVLDAHPDAAPALDADDDVQVQDAMRAAVARVHARCPGTAELLLEVYDRPFRLGPGDNWPTDAFATGRVADVAADGRIASYHNRASERVRQVQRADERAARLAAQRAQVQAFADAHAITAWHTSTDVDRNPYALQGERIGMLLRLERMLDAATALATQADDDGGRHVVVTGVTPATFSGPATAVAAEVDAERATVPGIAQPLARVRLVAAASCDDGDCATWRTGITWRARLRP